MTEDQLYTLRDTKKTIGDTGENFVLSYERRRLQHHPHLQEVTIVGRKDIGLGYDIHSFEGLTSTTLDRYIEVKTYSGQPHFFLSQGEWAAAKKYAGRYHVYLVDYSKINTPGYEPTIIKDPANTLTHNGNWSENIQQREYTLTPKESTLLSEDFDTSTILIGCFKDNPHKNWILHNKLYNVREDIARGHSIPGAVAADEIGMGARYLILYNVCEPRSHRIYTINSARLATNAEMHRLKYPNPRCPAYVLYRLSGVTELPPVDIMGILRSNNDKMTRKSGTPIYLSGSMLRRYFIDATLANMTGASAPKRVFTNEGKPWSANQSMRLEVLASMHRTIAEIAHELKRTPAEIHAHLHVLGIE